MDFPFFELEWWGYVLIGFALTHVTIVSVTIFLHRCQAHSALELHPVLSHFFRFWLWLTTGIVTKEWVAVHRKHHATVETDDDPHSPQRSGIHAVLWGGLILYRRAARLPGILEKFGKNTPDDWLERHIYAGHPNLGLLILLGLNLYLFGIVAGLAIWIVEIIWIPFWAAGVINGVGHFAGYRNFNLPDASRNIVPWGLLIGGEELHNNHHAYASSAQFSARGWEIDLGWLYIRLLSAMKLLKVHRKIPVITYHASKHTCDAETVKAFVSNRFQVLSNYVREVVDDVCREEIRSASGDTKKLLKKTKRLLDAEKSMLSEKNQERLRHFLETNKRLQKVYLMKESLHNIATRSSPSYETMRNSLDDWCRNAEASGIEALMRFSIRLKGSVSA